MRSLCKQIILTLLLPLFLVGEEVHIGLVIDGPEQQQDLLAKSIHDEITTLLSTDFTATLEWIAADWTELGIEKALDTQGYDQLVAAGMGSSLAAVSSVISFNKAIETFREDWKAFLELTELENVAFIGDASLGIHQEIFADKGTFIPITYSANEALAELDRQPFQAVFLLPTWRLPNEGFQELITAINSRKLPSFSFSGEDEVENGVLATQTSTSDLRKIARRIALTVQERLLYGKTVQEKLDIHFDHNLVINETTLKTIGLSLSWNVLTSARFIDPPAVKEVCRLDLLESVDTALRDNYLLNAERYQVRSGFEDVRRSRSELLPQLLSHADMETIDADRARFAQGAQPQRSIRGGVTLQQSIFEERKRADYDVQKRLQGARIYDKETLRYDTIRDTSLAYLSVLRAKSIEAIERENLELTRGNLKFAQDRVDSGQARKSEVYRWQSEIATNQRAILAVEAQVETDETNFNRLLSRPLQAHVLLQEVNLRSDLVSMTHAILAEQIETPEDFKKWSEQMVCIGKRSSPELDAFDQEILAQERLLTAADRAFYLPDVKGEAEIANRFARSGAGSDFPKEVRRETGIDYTDVTVRVELSYPLYTSGKRQADRSRAYYNLQQLIYEKSDEEQRVDQRVRNALDRMLASYRSIKWTGEAKESASNNLRIVSDSYARGVSSIVDLIDAQETLLDAKKRATNALYDFLDDFIETQRAIGHFEFLLNPCQKEELQCHMLAQLP